VSQARLRKLSQTRGRAPACSPTLDHIDEGAISTIHGFCQRLLAEHPIESGLPPRFEVLDEVQQSLEWRAMVGRSRCFRGRCGLSRAVPGGLPPVRSPDRRARARRGRGVGSLRHRAADGLAVVAAVEAIVTGGAAMVVAALDMALAAWAVTLPGPTDRLASGWAISGRIGTSGPDDAMEDQLAALVRKFVFGGALGNKASWLCD